MSAIQFLLDTFLNILTVMFLLRFLMQLFKVPFYNPVGQLVITLTDFAVRPIRRLIPSWRKMDLSTLVLALLSQLLLHFLSLWLKGFPFSVADSYIWTTIIQPSLIGIILTTIHIYMFAIFLQVILSWVNPHTPIGPILNALTKPILNPIQKLIPPINGIDFSPMIALILLQMVNISL